MKNIEEILLLLEEKVKLLIEKNAILLAERDILFNQLILLEEKYKNIENKNFSATLALENISNIIDFDFEKDQKKVFIKDEDENLEISTVENSFDFSLQTLEMEK